MMNRRTALKKTTLYTGLAFSSSAIISLLQSCGTEGAVEQWAPVFLDREQADRVAAIAEIILPKSGTPGAKDLGIDRFVDHMLKDIYPKEKQDLFLAEVNAWKESLFLPDQTDDQLQKAVTELDAKAFSGKLPDQEKEAYLILKELTLLAYFTSEEVMTTQLNYQPVAGRHDACIPLGENDKVFVDNNVIQ